MVLDEELARLDVLDGGANINLFFVVLLHMGGEVVGRIIREKIILFEWRWMKRYGYWLRCDD